jgi:hypothetical protein
VSRRWIAAALCVAPGCITPSVVDSAGRGVEAPAEVVAWHPATATDLRGLFESVSIEGEAAAALGRVLYHFGSDGSYTGAALVIGGDQPEFQTLSGTWTLGGDGLDLGDGQIVAAEVAGDLLRLSSAGGTAVLRRTAIQ